MPIARVQVALQAKSGLPEDQFVNTWHFWFPTLSAANADDLANAVWLFYSDVGGAVTLSGYLSPFVPQNGHRIKVYDLSEAEPRVPLYDGLHNLPTAPAGTPAPEEVALCLSMRAAPVSGFNQARRRGRIFVGPFDSTALGSGVNSESRPAALLMTEFLRAGELVVDTALALGAQLAVFSPTTGPASYSIVAQLWVDNAFDTQRRRGTRATTRTFETVP